MIAPEGTDTSRSEVMCKVCMDGFGEDQFTKTVKCFQIGFSVTSVAGVQVPDVNSRNNFQPIATCEGAEEDVAPVVLNAWGEHMLRLTGEDHSNVLMMPDGTMRIRLATPFPAKGCGGCRCYDRVAVARDLGGREGDPACTRPHVRQGGLLLFLYALTVRPRREHPWMAPRPWETFAPSPRPRPTYGIRVLAQSQSRRP